MNNLCNFSKDSISSGKTNEPGSISIDFYKLGHIVFVTGFVVFGKENNITNFIQQEYRPANDVIISCIIGGNDSDRAYAYGIQFLKNGDVKIYQGQLKKVGILVGMYSII